VLFDAPLGGPAKVLALSRSEVQNVFNASGQSDGIPGTHNAAGVPDQERGIADVGGYTRSPSGHSFPDNQRETLAQRRGDSDIESAVQGCRIVTETEKVRAATKPTPGDLLAEFRIAVRDTFAAQYEVHFWSPSGNDTRRLDKGRVILHGVVSGEAADQK
jgi:hypothetical protein